MNGVVRPSVNLNVAPYVVRHLTLVVALSIGSLATAFENTQVSGPGSSAPLLLTKSQWTWEEIRPTVPGATYNVYRREPPDGFGCLLMNHGANSWTGDSEEPPAGTAWWYTVNGDDGWGQNFHGSSIPITTNCRCSGAPPVSGTGLDLRLIAGDGDFDRPVHVTTPPDDPSRIVVTQLWGIIRLVKRGVLQPTPFLDLSALAHTATASGEEGVFAVAFHPRFATNHYLYVSYTAKPRRLLIERYEVNPSNPDVADPTTAKTILTLDKPADGHNGGGIAFGNDGYLYISVGDGGGSDGYRAQDPTSKFGSILRIDVDGGDPYAIPPDNPYFSSPLGAPEVWAYGLRNPWRFALDPLTRDLYIGDVGEFKLEELNVQPGTSLGGENYGWNIFQGTEPQVCSPTCDPAGLTFPLVTYDHSVSCSIVAGALYRGCRMPDLHGTFFYADFCPFRVFSLEYVGGAATNQQTYTEPWTAKFTSPASFGVDARGEMYFTNYREGSVYQFIPR